MKRRDHHRVSAETVAHAIRGHLGAVITRAALTEETNLLVRQFVVAAQRPKTFGEARVALATQLARLAPRHAVQLEHRRGETLRDPGPLEVSERSERVKAQPPARGREVLSPEGAERLSAAKRLRLARSHHHARSGGELGAEQAVGDAE